MIKKRVSYQNMLTKFAYFVTLAEMIADNFRTLARCVGLESAMWLARKQLITQLSSNTVQVKINRLIAWIS